ncbi:SDR family NAD(P)-dependent oxidoreductase [Myxococcus stipitatus]|uniref:type I polyketide synthase n=1 Tax=Myxococcus stipitatus TaxID=83455 RepID=UPI001F3899E1|nr:type I polyketide synthase [Myxococcus stipitatus]MCE9672544.1 SDR family NAD(P)-dependent oxidoreductase [Myxococcus stipitatus]
MADHESNGSSSEELTPLQRAALAIKTLRARVDALEQARSEPIAIIGMGCRFPGGADSARQYWELLREGVDAVGPVPADRWDAESYFAPDPDAPWKMVVREGGFLSQPIAAFDCEFFNLSPREASYVDPQQRLMLEVSWEALEDAGIAPGSLAGSDTGVYVGFLSSDYGRVPFNALPTRDLPYMGTGNELSFSAGRVSYVLGLQGPSMVVATACSSALVSVHLACQALRQGECSLALAGGVNLVLHPDNNIVLSKMRALAPDGRSKTFDASANGYGRGEGCGVLVLKRLSDARRDGDRVLAVVRGSAVNHDGPSGGLTVPHGPAQEKLLRKALRSAGLAASDVGYVEAHGTGTPLGDPIELRALDAVLGEGRREDEPLLVGSVKTNLGHLESAAGAAGILKVVLSLRHGAIPAHLHLKNPNPAVDWGQLRLAVPTSLTPWPAGPRPRVAGISGFGLSGVNAHVLVEEAPPEPPRAPEPTPRPVHLLALSARTPEALEALARRHDEALGGPELASASLEDICFTANTGRTHFPHRLALVAPSREAMRARLQSFLSSKQEAAMATASRGAGSAPRIAFLFTGQGAQWVGMGEELFRTEPSFRQTLLRCDEVLAPLLGQSLLSLLYPLERDEVARGRLDATGVTQPALFALEYALARLWMQWGVLPDFVMGHSVGELVAACVAGVFSLEEGLALIATRARLMQSLPAGGAMAAVSAEPALVEGLLARYDGQLSIAALNGPRSVVISGRQGALSDCLGELGRMGKRATPLRVSHAFHSALMEPILEEFGRAVGAVKLRAPTIPLVSNVSGMEAGPEILEPRYWVEHVRRPVMFARSLETLSAAGIKGFLEVGPRPTLIAMGQGCIANDGTRWWASLRPERSDWEQLLEGLASLYVAGVPVNWRGLDEGRERRKVSLPSYPFQRRRHWMELSDAGWERQGVRDTGATAGHPLLGKRLASASQVWQFESRLGAAAPAFLRDHRVHGQLVVPGAAYVEMGLAVEASLAAEGRATLEDVVFTQPLLLPEEGTRRVQLLFTPEGERSGRFEVFSQDAQEGDAEPSWTLHAHGRRVTTSRPAPAVVDLARLRARLTDELPVEAYYEKLGRAGLAYGPGFRAIRGLWRGDGEVLARLELTDASHAEPLRLGLAPALLDACFQAVGAVLEESSGATFLPAGVGRIDLHVPGRREAWVHARVTRDDDPKAGGYTSDLSLLTSDGEVVASVDGLRLRRVSREVFLGARSKHLRNWLYELEWREAPLAGPAREGAPGGADLAPRCVLLVDEGGVGRRLAEGLRARGWRVSTVAREPRSLDGVQARVEPLLLAREDSAPLHVIDLWSLDAPGSEQEVSAAALAHGTRGLALAQALVRARGDVVTSLWLVTRATQPAISPGPVVSPVGAALWGLGKAVAREHPELHCRRVDLSHESSRDEVDQLLAEVLTNESEDEVALRGARRLVPRLARSRRVPEAVSGSEPLLRADGSYLVTGGLGGLGLAVARRLAERGARHLVLVSRGAPGAEAQASLASLREQGVDVHLLACDVSATAELERAVLGLEGRVPPIRGVVHAAGVVDDGLLMQMTPERFSRVFASKVAGGWNLHRMFSSERLDFFVLFSSAASLMGSAGQANYVAANAFLDSLAHHRRGVGLPGLSLDWGAWAEVGAAADPQLQRRMEMLGFGVIPPEDGLSLLERSLSLAGQLGILPVDWEVLGRRGRSPLYEDFVRQATPSSGETLRVKLDRLPPADRRTALRAHVGALVNGVLGRAVMEALDPDQGFFDLGMDSLMSVELRNVLQRDLGVSLPATIAFDNPTVNALTEHLASEVLGLREEVAAPSAPRLEEDDRELDALLADVDVLDDGAVQDMLRRRR